MTKHKATPILDRLENGFRADSAHLKELEKDLAVTLQCARFFGKKHASPDDWNTHWQKRWDNVEGILHRIRGLVNEVDDCIESGDSGRLKKALGAWETIQAEDAKLAEALIALRAQAGGMNAAVRNDWNILARALESHFETIQTCSQAIRLKFEMLKAHSKEEVDRLVRGTLAKLPQLAQAKGPGPENYEREYRNAAVELEQERHKFLGLADVIKGLLMWVETTTERARKNLALGSGPHEAAGSPMGPGVWVPGNSIERQNYVTKL